MTRSSRSRMADNRNNILAAAMALFRARGTADVGIAEVMAQAGMTQGGFYRHFASKDALAAEACAAAFAEAESAWRAAAAGEEGNVSAALAAFYLRPRPPERTCPILSFAADAQRAPRSALAREWRAGVARLSSLHAALTGLAEDRARVELAALVGARLLALDTAILDDGRDAATYGTSEPRSEGEMP